MRYPVTFQKSQRLERLMANSGVFLLQIRYWTWSSFYGIWRHPLLLAFVRGCAISPTVTYSIFGVVHKVLMLTSEPFVWQTLLGANCTGTFLLVLWFLPYWCCCSKLCRWWVTSFLLPCFISGRWATELVGCLLLWIPMNNKLRQKCLCLLLLYIRVSYMSFSYSQSFCGWQGSPGDAASGTTLLIIVFLGSMAIGTILAFFLSPQDPSYILLLEDRPASSPARTRELIKRMFALLHEKKMVLLIWVLVYTGFQQAFIWCVWLLLDPCYSCANSVQDEKTCSILVFSFLVSIRHTVDGSCMNIFHACWKNLAWN